MENLKENIDYYIDENGFLVFTETYLLQRATCCGNGCRHCPYDYENVNEPTRRGLLLARQNEKTKRRKT